MNKGYTTKAIHVDYPKADVYGALHMPVYDGVGFEFGSVEEMVDSFIGKKVAHAYARTSNPTVEYFEHKMKTVCGAYNALAFSSGMAAISSVILGLVKRGENIVSSKNLFGHTYVLFKETLPSLGIDVRFADLNNPDEMQERVDDKTRRLFFEAVTNPQLEIADISLLSDFCKKNQPVLMCDSTTTPPYVFNSKKVGVDVEVMSTTKFISGGAPSFGGIALDNGTFNWQQIPALN